jgi:hypothetical protein
LLSGSAFSIEKRVDVLRPPEPPGSQIAALIDAYKNKQITVREFHEGVFLLNQGTNAAREHYAASKNTVARYMAAMEPKQIQVEMSMSTAQAIVNNLVLDAKQGDAAAIETLNQIVSLLESSRNPRVKNVLDQFKVAFQQSNFSV